MPIANEILRDYNASRTCVDKGAICHAAESSMYFGRDGAVSACCYSRSGAIGRYPEQSVQEIWDGALANSMRAALRRNELPGGCELCADQLHAGNFSGILAAQFDQSARPLPPTSLITRIQTFFKPGPRSAQYPVQLEFELSNKCNLECAMCSGFFSSSIRANRENLPALPQLYDSKFVDQLVPFLPHLERAKFLGGEPFLIDIYYEIWERLIELNPQCKVSITTNGTVFTDKVKRVLDELNCQIIVSLDSVVKPTYENIRVNASMEKTLANFEIFTEYNRRKNFGLNIAICPMDSNADELPELIDFASQRGAIVFFNTVIFPRKHSLKTQPIERQRELVNLFRSAPRDLSTPEARSNWDALESFTRQIEFWMGEQQEARVPFTPMLQRCADMLASTSTPATESILLRDLINAAEFRHNALIQLPDGNSTEALVAYFQAIWNVGTGLQREGLLPNAHFDRDQEAIFLAHLRHTVQPPQAQKIYSEVRRFPKIVLDLAGSTPADKLAAMIDEHLAAPTAAAVVAAAEKAQEELSDPLRIHNT